MLLMKICPLHFKLVATSSFKTEILHELNFAV